DLRCRPDQLGHVNTNGNQLPVHRTLDADQLSELRALSLPLPNARWRPTEDPRRGLVDAVLAEENLTLADLRFKGNRAMFFSKGERPALSIPDSMYSKRADDEFAHSRSCLRLKFTLPRGAYATLIVKRIMQTNR